MLNLQSELSRRRRTPGGPARLRRLCSAVVLGGLVIMLSGCMEALQSSQRDPIAWPTLPTATPRPTEAPPIVEPMSPTVQGSYAPDPATAAPTPPPTTASTQAPAPAPSPAPAAPLPTLTLPTPETMTNEERWRAQQIDRQSFEAPRPFYTTGSELWWYDPLNQQHIILGRISGSFLGQAQFTLRGQGVVALEVPYQVNMSYGLTALSPVVLDRIRAAGYSEWIETYVFLTPDVIPR